MRFPVGNDTQDFKRNWYNAQGYGVKTSYGYHEGDDFNLKTGGDSDLGQPIFSIADGEVSSIHSHATGFGLHIHIYHPEHKVWSHYAHLKEAFVTVGQQVKEGQKIATLGKSGTQSAHLHFAIKNQPTGIDGVAKTLQDLWKWENPTTFIEQHLHTTMPDELQTILNKYAVKTAQELMSMFDKELSFLKDERDKNKALKEVNKKQLEDHNRFIERVAELIGSPKDETSIIEFCSRFNSSLDEALEYKDKWEREVQAHKETFLKHSDELDKFNKLIHTIEDEFEVKIEQLQDEHERAIKHLQDQLSQAQANAQIANDALSTATKFSQFWKWVVSLKGKK